MKLAKARVAEARGEEGAAKLVKSLTADIARLEAEGEQATTDHEVASAALKAIRADIVQLYEDERETFEAEAEEASAAAEQAVEAIRDQLIEASVKWHTASSAWTSLGRYVEGVGHVPVFPFDPVKAFAVQPRPAAYRHDRGEPVALPEGTVCTFVSHDGRTLEPVVGTDLYRLLNGDPAWRLMATREPVN